MKISGNTILITGGASGIGLALAERFVQAGNTVIICGRRADKLQELKERYPDIHTVACDLSVESHRLDLFRKVTSEFPDLNVLINNAGIQQRVHLLEAENEWAYYRQEISINVDAPIHLTLLFIPHLLKQPDPVIVNVTSGLSITPGAWVPIYSSTKAALHSFTVSLRIQLAQTNAKVIEVLPPAVNTDLGGEGLHTFGAPLDEFADSVFRDLQTGKEEIGYGGTEERLHLSAIQARETAARMYDGFRSGT